MNGNVNIAFCFDGNLWMQAGVAITSLLIASDNRCAYNIYCVVADDVIELYQRELKKIVNNLSKESKIIFKNAGDAFKDGYVCRYATASYYRLLMHKMFPEVDKMLYADVDVIFLDQVRDLYEFDMGDNYVAAALDNANLKNNFNYHCKKYASWSKYKFQTLFRNYVNMGVSLWNLKKIRETGIFEQWESLATEEFPYIDQDVINYSCQGKITSISPVYNVMPANYGNIDGEDKTVWQAMKEEKLISEREYKAVYDNPCIIHYCGAKPWNEKIIRYYEDWWYMAAQTPFASVFLARLAVKNNER